MAKTSLSNKSPNLYKGGNADIKINSVAKHKVIKKGTKSMLCKWKYACLVYISNVACTNMLSLTNHVQIFVRTSVSFSVSP